MRVADAAGLMVAFELGRRSARERPRLGARIRSAGDVAQAVADELAGLRRERVVVLACDAADQLRATVTLSEGALDRALFPVREILHAVLIHDGRSFAVAHNHPSGDPEPSSADGQATRAIRDAARVGGLRFLGHVVVVEDGWQEVR
jgi:DNA repair protein RadC